MFAKTALQMLIDMKNCEPVTSSKKAGIHIVLIDLGNIDYFAYPCLELSL